MTSALQVKKFQNHTHIDTLGRGGSPDVGVVAKVSTEALGVQILWDEVATAPVQRPAV